MKPIFKPQTEWIPPESFPDLSKYDEIAIDLETKDPELKTMGSGSVTSKGHIVGIAVAVHDWAGYYPIRHEGGGIHSVCGLNIGFMNNPSPVSFLNNVLPSLYLALSLSTDVDRYIL